MSEGIKATTKTEEFIDKTFEVVMGETLDFGRISEMSDRAFNQFERSVRNKFNNMRKLYKDKLVLKEEV